MDLTSFALSRRRARWQFALMLMVMVVLVGLLGYMIVAGLGPVEALYMTLITLTTTGFSDVASQHRPNNPAVMGFTIFLLVFGISALAYAFSVFLRSLIEGELHDTIGTRRTRRRVHFMKNHFIICGFGRMGQIIAESLRQENTPVVIIDSDPKMRGQVEQEGHICLIGDATHDEMLRQAAIEKARGLIAVTTSDPENLFITLSARQLNPGLLIVTRAVSPEAESKLLRAGASRVILPYKLGALQLAQAAMRPNVVDFIEIATRTTHLDIEIEEIHVGERSPLAGKALRDTEQLRELEVIVIGIRSAPEQPMHYNPSASTVIEPGDTLIALGKSENLARLRRQGKR